MPLKTKFYYTFKVSKTNDEGVISEVECTKWEEMGEPVGTYRVKPFVTWMGCTCPAYRKCKHQTCVEEAIDSGKVAELWHWRWDEVNGWQRLDDITPLEELGL